MKDKITFLAGINTFYDSGNDYIGVFGDVILGVFDADKKYSIAEIKNDINQKISIDIPLDAIQTILKRLRKKKQINYTEIKDIDKRTIFITNNGVNQKKENKKALKDIERETNRLINNIFVYLDRKFSKEVIVKEFNNFIGNNLSELVDVLDGDSLIGGQNIKIQQKIADFFVQAENENPEDFEILKSILFGKVIAYSFLNFGNNDKTAKINNLKVYLDTNIIFSILGYHSESYNKSALEMITILKNAGIKLMIFEFTLNEVLYKLENYWQEYDNYSISIPVDSIYFTLKSKGYTKSEVVSLIEGFEDELLKFNIDIDYNFEIQDLLDNDVRNIFPKLNGRKINKPTVVVEHDAAAIIAIKKLRGNTKTRILEKSRYIFITADSILVNFNKNISRDSYIPEVVQGSYLTSIFWMRGVGDSGNIFAHDFLAQYSRHEMISRKLWEKFINQVRAIEARDHTRINLDEIISYKETEKILLEKGESGIKDIINDNNIKTKRQDISDKDKKIIEYETEIKKNHEKFKNITEKIENRCRIFWKKAVNIGIGLLSLITVALLIWIIYRYGLEKVGIIYGGIALIFFVGFFGVSLIFEKSINLLQEVVNLKRRLSSYLIKKCIKKKKNDMLI